MDAHTANPNPPDANAKPIPVAEQLLGLTLSGWTVIEQLPRRDNVDLSGGYFSVGYIVKRENQIAFLKAFDLARVLDMAGPQMSPMQALMTMSSAFEFECSTMQRAQRMDRVVSFIDRGEHWVREKDPMSYVPYIIMERADHDVRQHLRDVADITTNRRLRLLHHVATGLMQLHSADIVHQDLKPSNMLVWARGGAKVGDLGRSSIRGTLNANDFAPFAGDNRYAPPEVLYNHLDPDWGKRRLPIDLFLLGSVIVFMFTQVSMTSLLFGRFLAKEHRPIQCWNGSWSGTFIDVLPYVENAFTQALAEFERQLPGPRNTQRDYRPPLVAMVFDLCQPDPTKRGTPTGGGSRTVLLNRAITTLDRLSYDA